MSSAKKTSDVWKYFTVQGNNTKCNLCHVVLSFKGGSTSSMRNHIKMRHKSASLQVVPTQKQSTLLDFNKSRKKLTKQTYESMNRSLAIFCALDLRPISLVEGRGFKQFIKKINPDYQVPCKKTVTKYVNILYDQVKAELVESIAGCTVAFTTDMWTSVARRGYITVTAHYLTDEWELLAKSIATRAVDDRHTGATIADVVIGLKNEFKIVTVKALVTDNAANMVSAAKEANIDRVACFSYTLQLAIGESLKITAITKSIAFGRNLVTHFNHSAMSVNALKEHQIKMGVKNPLTVIQDVCTRWNSEFLMVRRLLQLRVSLYGVLLDETIIKPSDRNKLAIPETSWKIMEDIVPVLEPFAEATELLTKEDSPTLSQVYVLVYHLLCGLQDKDDDSTAIQELKNKLRATLRKRFMFDAQNVPLDEALCSMTFTATFLDPRYKTLKFLPQEKKALVVEHVESLISGKSEVVESETVAAVHIKTEPDSEPEKKPLSSMLAWLSGDVIDLTVPNITTNSVITMLNQYVDEPVREPNPLKWWKLNQNKYFHFLFFI